MHSLAVALFWSLLALQSATVAKASLFFVKPSSRSTCTGGSPCEVVWEDDGVSPLLNTVGVVTAGLYTGSLQLVQTLQPVNVANTLSYQFTPIPGAGPNSNSYYIAFTSTQEKVNGTSYVGFSPFFTLKGMSGSFDNPVPSLTATKAIPKSLTETSGTVLGTTLTVGSVPNTSNPPQSTTTKPKSTSTSSSLTSLFTTSSDATSASQGAAIATQTGAAQRISSRTLPFVALFSLCALLI